MKGSSTSRSTSARRPSGARFLGLATLAMLAALAACGQKDDGAARPGEPIAIRGFVTDEDGVPVAGAQLELLPFDALRADDALFPRADVTAAARVQSDRKGHFIFPACEPGRWIVRAEAVSRRTRLSRPIRLVSGLESEDLRIRLGPGAKIAGRVVDDEGAGVAGAVVSLLEDEGRLAVATLPIRTTTDDEGAFVLAGVTAGEHAVLVEAGGWARSLDVVGAASRPSPVEIALHRGTTLRGLVVEGSGARARPVAGVRLVLHDLARSLAARPPETVSASDGSFTFENVRTGSSGWRALHLAAWHPTLQLDQPDPGRWGGSRALDVPLEDVLAGRTIRVSVSPGGTVAGRVVDQDGRPVSGARVRVSPPGVHMLGSDGSRCEVTTDATGSFRIGAVRPGRNVVLASHPEIVEPIALSCGGGEKAAPLRLASEDEDDGGEIVFPVIELPRRVEAGRTLSDCAFVVRRGTRRTGRVLTHQGRPLAGAVVQRSDRRDGDVVMAFLTGEIPVVDVTDALGRFAFEGCDPDRPVPYLVRHPDYRTYVRGEAPPAADGEDFEIRMPEVGRLEGRVLGPDGEPVEGLVLGLIPAGPPLSDLDGLKEDEGLPLRTDADGRFRADGVPVGRARIVLAEGLGEPQQGRLFVPPEGREAVVAAGSTTQHAFRLTEGASLSGRVVADDPDLSLEGVRIVLGTRWAGDAGRAEHDPEGARILEGEGPAIFVDVLELTGEEEPDGAFTFSSLDPSGVYDLTVTLEAAGTRRVLFAGEAREVAPGTEDLVIRLRRRD